jgi:hypothetical protein
VFFLQETQGQLLSLQSGAKVAHNAGNRKENSTF